MGDYAKCWVNGLGQRRWQPRVGKYHYWHGFSGMGEWQEYAPYRQGPKLYRFRWSAVRVAKRAERRWAKRNFNLCEGEQ